MADADYQRLGAACCLGVRRCRYCHAGVLTKPRQMYCSAQCRWNSAYRNKEKHLGRHVPVERKCAGCGCVFSAARADALNCSKACKQRSFWLRKGVVVKTRSDRALELARAAKDRLEAKVAESAVRRSIKATAVAATAYWKAEIKELRRWGDCKNCGNYCRMPGSGNVTCSDECRRFLRMAARHANRMARKAILKAARVDSVNPFKVFERDNWKCYLCGCDTPKALRGSYEPNAPEVEHVVPITRGGKDAYENVRCACRECNGIKGDRLLEEIGGAFLSA